MDIEGIERFWVERSGQSVANKYIYDLSEAFARLSEDGSLFRRRSDDIGRLLFYNIREHVIIGDVLGEAEYVLTVWWVGLDFIDCLPKLEPDLMREAELLAQKIDTD